MPDPPGVCTAAFVRCFHCIQSIRIIIQQDRRAMLHAGSVPAEDAAMTAAAAEASPAAAVAVAADMSDNEEEEFLELPEAQHHMVKPEFLDIAPQLRAHYEQR